MKNIRYIVTVQRVTDVFVDCESKVFFTDAKLTFGVDSYGSILELVDTVDSDVGYSKLRKGTLSTIFHGLRRSIWAS
jgi:hypothetical protein